MDDASQSAFHGGAGRLHGFHDTCKQTSESRDDDLVENPTTPFQKTTLDTGLRIVTSEMPHTRSVAIGIFIGVGSRYESPEQAGISHFIEHMVFKGTERRRTPWEISATIEGSGGVINAGTEQELTVYWCKVAAPDFHESLDLLFDMLRNSLFKPEDIDKERLVVIEELSMINDYPSYRVDALIDEMLWPSHPLGRDVGGTKASITDITRDMMLDHMARCYSPSNIVVSVAGNLTHQKVAERVESLGGGWPSASPLSWSPVDHMQSAPQFRMEYRKTEQTHLSIAVPGVSLKHPDCYALDLLSVILGEGMSSRLFIEVRETKGLAYDVHSGVSHFLDCGAFVAGPGLSRAIAAAIGNGQPGSLSDGMQLLAGQGQAKVVDIGDITIETVDRKSNVATVAVSAAAAPPASPRPVG